MTERGRIVQEMAESILLDYVLLFGKQPDEEMKAFGLIAATNALAVIEAPNSAKDADYSRICTCGNNGYNPPNMNHPHEEGCPQYG